MTSRSVAYERSDVPPRLLAGLAASAAAFLIFTPIALVLFYPEAAMVRTTTRIDRSIPSPRLQIDPASDLLAFQRAEEQRLTSYGWRDPQKKALRLPIDQAMMIAAERGLPNWPKPPAP